MYLWAILIFILAFVESYLLNTSAMTIISQSKISRVIPVSLATGGISRFSLLVIGKLSDWSLLVMAADVLGDTLGDVAVSKRWPKPLYNFLVMRKKKFKMGVPVNV